MTSIKLLDTQHFKVNNSQLNKFSSYPKLIIMNQLPSNNPLPLLLPLQPPLKVISIFQKYKQKDEIPSKKVEIHLKSPKKDDYKHLY